MISFYYDGLCRVCYLEAQHYRKCSGSENIRFVDISHPEFSATAESLDAVDVNRELHVRRSDGSLAVGVDAFIAIWQTLPKYRWLARLASQPVVNPFLRFNYRWFAKVRPYLPKRKDCGKSPYCAAGRS